jgi:hypothetical protein
MSSLEAVLTRFGMQDLVPAPATWQAQDVADRIRTVEVELGLPEQLEAEEAESGTPDA